LKAYKEEQIFETYLPILFTSPDGQQLLSTPLPIFEPWKSSNTSIPNTMIISAAGYGVGFPSQL
jgi:hypothetical protein